MKYDCSKCLDFVHEQERMCNDIEHEESCNGCGLDVLFGPCGTPDTQDKIDVVQNWSDEHPEPHKKTILEDFYEKFPDADINFKKMPLCCEVIYTGYTKCHECGNGCKQCWNRPHENLIIPKLDYMQLWFYNWLMLDKEYSIEKIVRLSNEEYEKEIQLFIEMYQKISKGEMK